MNKAIPVIVCGKSLEVGRTVIEGLKPEYEVIHFITSLPMAISDLPSILSLRPPAPSSPPNPGSGDFTRLPAAIIVGGGYNDEDFATMRKAVEEDQSAGGSIPTSSGSILASSGSIPWLRADMQKPHPPFGPEYARFATESSKRRLREVLGEDGEGKEGGVFWY